MHAKTTEFSIHWRPQTVNDSQYWLQAID
jgi:hypothetical protein